MTVCIGKFSNSQRNYEAIAIEISRARAIFGTLSLVESIQLGFVFGVNIRVLSVMIVFFFMGLGMVMFPKHAPELYASNTSSLSRHRGLQVVVGVLLMLVAIWFSISISLSSLKSPIILQPVVQSAIVVVIAILIYWRYHARLHSPKAPPERLAEAQERFSQAPSQ